MKAPLFLRFRSQAGIPYLFDSGTGEIIRVTNAVHEIVDDFHVLDTNELIAKHAHLGRGRVVRSLEELHKLQGEGLLPDHEPVKAIRPTRVVKPEDVTWADFLGSHRRMLTLEVTRSCNLSCAYCIFGGRRDATRRLGNTVMPWEVARRAVLAFLDRQFEKRPTIAFYGGEPLLQFGLIKRVIALAEDYAQDRRAATPIFHLATNGTLLSEDAIHYLVAKDVSVAISLDGSRASHDRHRVFASTNKEKSLGSFTTVTRNIDRFIELYPDYSKRALQATLTATNEIQESDRFFKRYVRYFPEIRANFVSGEVSGPADTPESGYGCRFVPERDGECQRVGEMAHQDSGSSAGGLLSTCPEFCSWTGESLARLHTLLGGFVEAYIRDPEAARNDHPILHSIVTEKVKKIHFRPVFRPDSMPAFTYKCMPGSMRLFCSVEGNYYPCERGENSELSVLGNVWDGFSRDRADTMSALPGAIADCRNCAIGSLCSICPAVIAQFEQTNCVDGALLHRSCTAMKDEVAGSLTTYTSIMERNPSAFDVLANGPDLEPSWLKGIRFLRPPEPLSGWDLGLEELPLHQPG